MATDCTSNPSSTCQSVVRTGESAAASVVGTGESVAGTAVATAESAAGLRLVFLPEDDAAVAVASDEGFEPVTDDDPLVTAAAIQLSTEPSDARAVHRTFYDSRFGRNLPLRNGYYDRKADKGFGYRKLVAKHGLTDNYDQILADTIERGTRKYESGRTVYRGKIEEVDGSGHVYDYTILRVVADEEDFNTPDGMAFGIITAYCQKPHVDPDVDYPNRCPQWFYDLEYIG